MLTSTQYEFDLAKVKAKNRETDLVAMLEEARSESRTDELNEKIKSLQDMLKKTEEELFTLQSNESVLKAPIDGTQVHLDRIKTLESEIVLFREDREAMKEKMKVLEKENSTISEQLIDAVQDAESLQQKVKKLEEEISSKDNKIEELVKEQLKLTDEMMESIQEAERLQKDLTNLQIQHGTQTEENKNLFDKIAECNEKIASFEKIQEMLINGNVEEIEEDDDFGKIILKMHHNSSKTESLELEKLQLLEEIDSIRKTVVNLSEQLVVTQNAVESEQQLKTQVEMLSDELIKTKEALEENLKKNNEQYLIIDELRCKLEESEGSSVDFAAFQRAKSQLAICDATIDDLKQQLVKLARENSHMAATLKECESLESEVESLTNQKAQMQVTIDDLLTKIPVKVEVHDKSAEIFGDSINESAIEKEYVKVQIDTLNCEIDSLKEVVEKNKKEIVDIEEENSNLKKKIEESSEKLQEISELKEKASEYEKIIAEKTISIEDLTKKLEASQDNQDFIEFQLQIASKDKKISLLETKIEELQQDSPSRADHVNMKLSADLQKISGEYQSLQNSHREIFEEYNKLMEQAEELTESNDKMQIELERLEPAFEVLQQDKDDLDIKLKSLEEENENLKSKLVEKHENEAMEKDNKIAELEGKIQSLEDLLNMRNAQNTTDDEKTRLETENQTLLGQNQELVTQNEALKTLNDDVKTEFAETKSQLDEKCQMLTSQQVQIKNLEAELSSLKSCLNEKLETISSLENQLSSAKSSLEEKSSLASELPLDYNEKVEEIEKLKNEVEKLNVEISKLTTENSNLNESINELNKLHSIITSMSEENQKLISAKSLQEAENEKLISDSNSQILQLDVKVTNLTSAMLIKDEKIAQLDGELKKTLAEFEESKTRLRRRSVDTRNKTDALEAKISELTSKIGEMEALKAGATSNHRKLREEFRKISAENKKLELLNDEYDIKLITLDEKCKHLSEEFSKISAENEKLKLSSDDNDMKFAVLDEKYSQLSEMNEKLNNEFKLIKSTADTYKQEIESLNTQLSHQMSENFTHSKTVGELREKCEILTKQLDEKKKLSVSPRQRRSSEQEILPHKQLLAESNSGTPVRTLRSNQERKTRRQSVYDDNRRLSAWEKFQTVETQTDAVDEMCACCDLREKLKKVTKDLRIAECKIANFERMANAHPLKADLKQAQTDLEKEKKAHAKSKDALDEANRKIAELMLNQKTRVDHVTRSVQVGSNLFEKVSKKNILK
jgi:chromosome segregation ATPase